MRVNIGLWSSKNARLYKDKKAIVAAGRSVSYAEMNERVNRLASALLQRGFRKGDRLGLLLFNSIEYLEAFFACAKTGMIAVPLNFRLAANELAYVLNDCTARGLLYDPMLASVADSLADTVPSLSLLVRTPLLGESFAGPEVANRPTYGEVLASGSASECLDSTVGNDDVVLLMYTSGTTGRPKGVMLTHENCFFQSVNGWALGISPEVVSLVVLPLFHVGGLNGSVTPILHVGGTVLLVPKFDAAEVLRLAEEHQVHGIMAVPTVYQMLLEHPDFKTRNLSSVKVLISGGAPLPEALMKSYYELGYEMRQGYGLTEASPGVSGMGPGDFLLKPGSVGKPCLYTEIKIVDPALDWDTNAVNANDLPALPPGQVGEIIVSGPNVMKGYWNLPGETTRVLRNDWLITGDLGSVDDDGFVYIKGRKKEMLITGGENVYPGEVEQVLCNHSAVAMAAVVGRPDKLWGEVPVAFVMLYPGHNTSSQELLDFCSSRLARYKTPKDVFIEPVLPMNASGKILKAELKTKLLQ